MFWTNLTLIKFVFCFLCFCTCFFLLCVSLCKCLPPNTLLPRYPPSILARTPTTSTPLRQTWLIMIAINEQQLLWKGLFDWRPFRALPSLKCSRRGHGHSYWIQVAMCTRKSSKSSFWMLVWMETSLTTRCVTRNLGLQGTQSKNSSKFVCLLSRLPCNMMIDWTLLSQWWRFLVACYTRSQWTPFHSMQRWGH